MASNQVHEEEKTVGKGLVVVGFLMAGVGALILLGLPFGRLPGDLVCRRGGTTVYFPVATSVLLSIVLTLALMFTRR